MCKKLLLIALFTLLPASFLWAQTTVFAYIKDELGKPIENVEINLKGSETVKTDKIGYFQFVDLKEGRYQIVIAAPNLETKVMDFDVATEKRKDLGEITVYSSLNNVEQGLTFIENTGDEENSSQSSTVGLLQSSQDIFSRLAAFDLGAYWFRPRGIDGRSGETFLNGISMVKSDNGNVDFGNWGGLNEITRYPEVAVNHSPSEYSFGGVSSVFYKNTKASEYRKGFQFTQSLTNRNYRNRTSLRYSSGMNSNGWAFTLMGARRWAQEGIQEGTFYDSYGAYVGIEKKFNDNHTITFNAIGAPQRRSTASPSTQEVYDLRGVHYNAYWGYQDGERRSERVKKGFQPLFQLQDFWKINDKSTLWTSLSYQFGKDRGSRLDWQNVSNPSPAYYRKLPSYYKDKINAALALDPNADVSNLVEAYNVRLSEWQNGDPNITQINWGQLYQSNMNQPVETLFGTTGKKASYFMVDDVSDEKIWNASTHYTYDFNDTSKFILNLSYQNYTAEQYREVNDLLGADFALNQDAFADTNQPGKSGLYNEGETNVAKRVGDRINYSYIFRREEFKVNPGLKFSTGKFDMFVSASASYNSSSREGLFKHYLYADSFGKSADVDFWNFGLKGQAIYRINGRNFIVYNGAVFNQAPFLEDLFINPRVNSSMAPNVKSTAYIANDLSYVLSTPKMKLRITGFMVDSQNETNVQRFFADGIALQNADNTGETNIVQSAFLTQVMSNVEKRNLGAELGLEYKLTPSLSFQGLASYGQYTYRNNPTTYFASDAIGTFSNGKSFADLGESYLKDYFQGGTPQTGYSAGLRYNSPKFWWVGASYNYLDNNYLDPSALIRTESFVQNSTSGTPDPNATESELRRLLQQTKLPSAGFINANVGKSWIFGKYYVLISASVNNILDNTNYITGGFEQTRNVKFQSFKEDNDREQPLFGPKYWYTQGRSYFVNLQFRF